MAVCALPLCPGRDSRLGELQKKWWESAMGRPKSQKEEEDMDQATKVG
jgi:hypothetical protein